MVLCQIVADKCVIFFFSSSGRNSQVHSWPLPVSVCLRRGAGSVVIDSSEGGV